MKTRQRKVDVENIQIDHGIVFRNYGLETQKLLAPIRGGSTFKELLDKLNLMDKVVKLKEQR